MAAVCQTRSLTQAAMRKAMPGTSGTGEFEFLSDFGPRASDLPPSLGALRGLSVSPSHCMPSDQKCSCPDRPVADRAGGMRAGAGRACTSSLGMRMMRRGTWLIDPTMRWFKRLG